MGMDLNGHIKSISAKASLEPNKKRAELGYGTQNYHTLGMSSRGGRTVEIVNTTKTDVLVVHADGIPYRVPRNNSSMDDCLTVIIRYELSRDVVIPWRIASKFATVEDRELLEQARLKFETDRLTGTYGNTVLEFFYVIDLVELNRTPAGVWIEQAGIQLVDPQYEDRFELRHRVKDKGELDYSLDARFSKAVVESTIYVVNTREQVDSVYVPTPLSFEEVKPIYDPSLEAGVYISRSGGNNTIVEGDHRKGRKDLEFIPVQDFEKHCIFRSNIEMQAFLKRSPKGFSKDETDRIAEKLKYLADSGTPPPQPDMAQGKRNLADQPFFFDYTLRDITQFFVEVNKLQSAVEKVFNPK